MKPTVYIETGVIGHLTSRLPRDIVVAGQMVETRRWWNQFRGDFDLWISNVVIQEISQGDPTAAAERFATVQELSRVPLLQTARDLSDKIVQQHGMPKKAHVDALHLAICATNGINYLLTWNCRHIANATRRNDLHEICRQSGYTMPIICTPSELEELRHDR